MLGLSPYSKSTGIHGPSALGGCVCSSNTFIDESKRAEWMDEPEGRRLDSALPPVIDGHVHLFPDRLFEAVWRWFETHAWPIRYPLKSPDIIRFLLDRGVQRIVALQYAHKPGIALAMNEYMAAIVSHHPQVIGMATVLPGEPGAVGILKRAFADGLAGVKLHCHVQCFGPDSPHMHAIYQLCEEENKPLVIHAGREPSSPAYLCDPYTLCAADRIERVLKDYPRLKVCVPHFGADELDAYEGLLTRYDNLWLDTAMVVGRFFEFDVPPRCLQARPDRILYGTDFPNLPYAWAHEIKRLAGMKLGDETLVSLLAGTAEALYGLDPL